MEQLFKFNRKSKNYIRLEPTNLSSVESSMDAASQNNIQKLISLADRLMSDNEDELNRIVDHLIKDNYTKNKKNPWSKLMDRL